MVQRLADIRYDLEEAENAITEEKSRGHRVPIHPPRCPQKQSPGPAEGRVLTGQGCGGATLGMLDIGKKSSIPLSKRKVAAGNQEPHYVARFFEIRKRDRVGSMKEYLAFP